LQRYIELCPHGVTTGSKFLYRSESVRDPVDLKLSKQFTSPVNVLDTPCTAASNLLIRDKETAETWFSDRRGSFEKPVHGQEPSEVSILSLKFHSHMKSHVQLPKKEELKPHEHPKTRKTDKYICGDRFHDKQFPHKSELSRYHNINLVPQLKAARTSEQENLNSNRNRLRLRSTCTQNLGTHLFYNAIIMDRASNRGKVQKQLKTLKKTGLERHPDNKFVL